MLKHGFYSYFYSENNDKSVFLLLKVKQELSLFENSYIDVYQAVKIVGNASFQAKADVAMRKSIVLLRNENSICVDAE